MNYKVGVFFFLSDCICPKLSLLSGFFVRVLFSVLTTNITFSWMDDVIENGNTLILSHEKINLGAPPFLNDQ